MFCYKGVSNGTFRIFLYYKKRALLIVLITLVATLASGIISYFIIKPVTKADISVIIGKTEKDNALINQNYNDVSLKILLLLKM